MEKIKVMTIVGTRPEVIKLSRVIAELKKHTQHVLVHTGQNYAYELNQIFFDELGIDKPWHFLDVAQTSMAETVGNIIARSDLVLEKEKPDAVLIYGDTNSSLSAYAAKRRKIPVFHMEAGNRCFDQRVPEEINRKIVDHISDINLTISEHARQYLLAEGLPADRVIKVGSCMKEILTHYQQDIERANPLAQLQLLPKQYFILSSHREENVDDPVHLEKLFGAIEKIATHYQMPVIVSTHPRTEQRLQALPHTREINSLLRFLKPFGFFSYVQLMKNAFCVLSDSGSLTEDASLLDFPAVTVREQHERPEGMDVGTLVMSGLSSTRILQSIDLVTRQYRLGERNFEIVPDYEVPNVSRKVVRIILSYIDYVHRTVWNKV